MKRHQTIHLGKSFFLYALLFLSLLVCMILRLPYGSANIDEGYYLAVPWQMLQGGAYLLHQWHPGQMAGFLIEPLLCLVLLFHPSTDGIFLLFRYLFLFFHSLTSLVIYCRLREKDPIAAVLASLIYLSFLPMGIPALSYNSMGIGLLTISLLTLGLTRGHRWEALLSGLCFAGAVLCCPFLVILYLLYTIFVPVVRILKKPDFFGGIFCFRTWLLFSLMCVLLAALFFLKITLHGDIHLLVRTLPMILSNPSHALGGMKETVISFFRALRRISGFFKPVAVGSLILTVVLLLDPSRKSRRGFYFLLASLLTFVFSLSYFLTFRVHDLLIFPFSILGFFAFLLCEQKETRLFVTLFIPGLIYCFCINTASDMAFLSIGRASAVCMPASILFIIRLMRELSADARRGSLMLCFADRSGIAAAAIMLAALYGTMLWTLCTTGTNGHMIRDTTERIPCGAQQGLYETPGSFKSSVNEYEALSALREIPEGGVLYLERGGRRFLEDPKLCCSFDMWFAYSPVSLGFDRMELYWELFPDRRPDFIYLRKNEMENPEYMDCMSRYPYTMERVETGAVFTMNWND